MGSGASGHHPEEPLIILTFAPQKKSRFSYCESHGVYTNDAARVLELPAPRPPLTRKREIFNAKTYAHVDRRVKNFFFDLERPIDELVHQLTSCYGDDDVAKVRAMYQWFTSQPVETTEYQKSKTVLSTQYQLWHVKNKHINYADFFSILCWFAGIPCVIIRGILKGSTYEVAEKMSRDNHMGEWNAVLIDGTWRFIDTFWGACIVLSNVSGSKYERYLYQADEGYFLTDPDILIYSHFPDEPAWQLLPEQKSLEEFEYQAVLKERFFSFKMKVLTHHHCTVEAVDGKVGIYFVLHPSKSLNQSFICLPSYVQEVHGIRKRRQLKFPKENVVLMVNQNRKQKELGVHVKFPLPGTYILDILGKDTEKLTPGYDYDWVAVYRVQVLSVPSEPVKGARPQPKLTADGFGPGENLRHLGLVAVEPNKGVINMNPGNLYMQFNITNPVKFNKANISANMFGYEHGMQSEEPSVTAALNLRGRMLKTLLRVREGEHKVAVMYKTESGNALNICNYNVICEAPPEQEKTPEPEQKKPTPRKKPVANPEAEKQHAMFVATLEKKPESQTTEKPVIKPAMKPEKTLESHATSPVIQHAVKPEKPLESHATPPVIKPAVKPEKAIETYAIEHTQAKPVVKPEKAPTPKPTPVQTSSNGEIEELRKQFTKAMTLEDVEGLETAIEVAEKIGRSKDLQTELREARQLLVRLYRLKKAVSEVLKLDQRAIAEIRSYSRPIPAIHRVMQATLLLLGHMERETKLWKNIQVVIGKTGKLSLKRRIKELDMRCLDRYLVERSQTKMAGIELRDIVQYSVGVATFFSWTQEVTENSLSKQDGRDG